MSLPSYVEFIDPLLRHLVAQKNAVRARDVYEVVAAKLGLTEEQKAEMLPSGQQAVYQNRTGWANDRLKRAGLTTSPSRGHWTATDKGRAFVKAHPKPLTAKELESIWKIKWVKNAAAKDDGAEQTPASATDASPQERIELAVRELNESVGAELLERIHEGTPKFFEKLVLDLLLAMGYGTSRSELQHVGGSGDAGIDGIISLDKLGLEKVYVQAKRWQGSVGRPALQGFFGALAGRKANKGVFITTASFTKDAKKYAASVSGSLVLVDGARLAELMIEYGVGVSHTPVRIARIDSDYFEEG